MKRLLVLVLLVPSATAQDTVDVEGRLAAVEAQLASLQASITDLAGLIQSTQLNTQGDRIVAEHAAQEQETRRLVAMQLAVIAGQVNATLEGLGKDVGRMDARVTQQGQLLVALDQDGDERSRELAKQSTQLATQEARMDLLQVLVAAGLALHIALWALDHGVARRLVAWSASLRSKPVAATAAMPVLDIAARAEAKPPNPVQAPQQDAPEAPEAARPEAAPGSGSDAASSDAHAGTTQPDSPPTDEPQEPRGDASSQDVPDHPGVIDAWNREAAA